MGNVFPSSKREKLFQIIATHDCLPFETPSKKHHITLIRGEKREVKMKCHQENWFLFLDEISQRKKMSPI